MKLSMDKGWLFHLGDVPEPEVKGHTYSYMAAKAGGAVGGASPSCSFEGWEPVDLPHDWAVYGEFHPNEGPAHGYKPRGEAWYVKRFRLDEADHDKQILVEFEGISSHAAVYCNGSVVARSFCGYTSFTADITDMAVFGDKVNTLSVYVDANVIEGWWYEGAGIYRHVNMYKKNKLHIKHWGVFVKPVKKTADVWDTNVEITVENSSYQDREFTIRASLKNAKGTEIGHKEEIGIVRGGSDAVINTSILTYSPELWDVDSPNMYTMDCEVFLDGESVDSKSTLFGYRTIEISADNGFILNGRRVQLYGTCNHQDHAGVGVAVPDSINEYRIQLLKEMGTNAFRCSHGNPNPEILDLCDKYGMLVMDENRNFNSSPEGVEQVRSMVLRDRNHPSVVMYSVFNEEPHQGTATGRRIAERLACEIRRLDDTRFLLGAMNTGLLEDVGCADLLDITGFNYITHMYDPFREKYPNQPMIGSENDSAFQTRGEYTTIREKQIIDSYDSEAAAWGNTYRDGFKQVDIRKHIMGMFIWTGFDYRGEPTPFEWPSIGTQFGIMDTCGFKKDAFYLNKAFFTDEPMMHLLPHWNWEKGQKIKMMVHTNCDEAELFLNDTSLGRHTVDKYDMTEWEVEFESGTIRADGYRNGELVCSDSRTTSGAPAKIMLTASTDAITDDTYGAAAINVCVVDANGVPVPTADNLIRFITKEGHIIGVGNGDPNSHEKDKASERKLFNGLCQAIVSAEENAELVTVIAESDGLESAQIEIKVIKTDKTYIPSVKETFLGKWRSNVALFDEMPAADTIIEDSDMNTWGIMSPGDESKFDGTGYALYRTTAEFGEGAKTVTFAEVTGTHAWIYVNGELKYERNCKWGERMEIHLDGSITGTAEITVIIHRQFADQKTGLTKSVSVVQK